MNSGTELKALIEEGRVAVLTGAGCSTESGIPDYRGPKTRARARNPMKFRAFMNRAEARQRYWARAVVGFSKLRDKRPNFAHFALARLERAGVVGAIVTQNVDGLHQSAGSREVIELHGSLARVRCTTCDRVRERADFQRELTDRNPWLHSLPAELAPDGDADVGALRAPLDVPPCALCGGFFKPDVVFFGENVPKARVAAAYHTVDQSRCLLVVGSSLAVFSGYRFVRRAAKQGKSIAIVNLTESRGDAYADVCVRAIAGPTLSRLATEVIGSAEATRSFTAPVEGAERRQIETRGQALK